MVGDVDRDDAAWFEMPRIEQEGFPSQKMNRDRVTAESIQRNHVKILGRLIFHRKPGIAANDFDLSQAIGEIGETGCRQPANVGIDFIYPKVVTYSAIHGDGSGAEADD